MPEHPARSPIGGRALVASAALLWSLGGVVTKGMQPLDGVTIAFYRSLFAGLALLPFIPTKEWTFRPSMLPVMLVFGAMVGFYLTSVLLTTAANAILLQYSCVFWTVPIAALALGERPDRRTLLAASVASVGIAAIVAYGRKGTPGEGLGIVLGLASGVGYATVIVAFRAFRSVDAGWLSAICNLGGAATLGGYAAIAARGIAIPTGRQAAALALFGVVQMAIPYWLFARGMRSIGAAEAALISLLEPILGPIWVAMVHGERLAPFTLVGGGILLAGVAIKYVPRGRAVVTPVGSGSGPGP